MTPLRKLLTVLMLPWACYAATSDSVYVWRNVVITAGGFVPGLVFHPNQPDLLYARTDVGGAYRWDPVAHQWLPLNDALDRNHWQWSGIASLALDPHDPNRLYLAGGSYPQIWGEPGALLRSDDRGTTWSTFPLPFKLDGNADGRNTGERLIVHPDDADRLLLATPTDGLWQSHDRGATWSRVAGLPTAPTTLVWTAPSRDDSAARRLFLALGPTTAAPAPIWTSHDDGATWSPLPAQPTDFYVQQVAFDAAGELYLTYGNHLGPNGVTAGAVWAFAPATGIWRNLTPALANGAAIAPHGFGGLAADPHTPGRVLVASLNRWSPANDLWRTTDGGRTWRSTFTGATWDTDGVAYVKAFTPHWISDVAIDPTQPSRAWFVTGYGLWTTDDIAPADGHAPLWVFANRNLEETVADELISPPGGAPLLSALGDIGGFRHDDLNTSPGLGTFTPGHGTSSSIAFAGTAPQEMVRTHSGENRAARSSDGGRTWRSLASAPAAAQSHGPGSLVINADASRLLWLPKGAGVYTSSDDGQNWQAATFDFTSPAGHLTARLCVDTVDPQLCYLYDPVQGGFYVSTNAGESFTLTQLFPAEGGRARAEPRRRGCVWVPAANGLYVSHAPGRSFAKLPNVDAAYEFGFGHAAPGAERDAVYLQGRVDGCEGLFRSDDAGATWERIDDPAHRYGYLRVVIGDGDVYGRVYLGTSGRGIIVGEPAGGKAPP